MKSSDPTLLELPDELLVHTFSFLGNNVELSRVAAVCQEFRRLVTDDALQKTTPVAISFTHPHSKQFIFNIDETITALKRRHHLLAVGTESGRVIFLDLRTNKRENSIDMPCPIKSLAWFSDTELLVGDNYNFYVVNWKTSSPSISIDTSICIKISNNIIAYGLHDGNIYLINSSTPPTTAILQGHQNNVTDLVVKNDLLLSYAYDKKIILWNWHTQTRQQLIDTERFLTANPNEAVLKIGLLNGRIIAATNYGNILFWDLQGQYQQTQSLIQPARLFQSVGLEELDNSLLLITYKRFNLEKQYLLVDLVTNKIMAMPINVANAVPNCIDVTNGLAMVGYRDGKIYSVDYRQTPPHLTPSHFSDIKTAVLRR